MTLGRLRFYSLFYAIIKFAPSRYVFKKLVVSSLLSANFIRVLHAIPSSFDANSASQLF